MIRYLKRYKLLLFITILFTTISSLSYVFIAILLQQVMDIVDMGDMEGFIRILLFSLSYFALMGVFMYLQSLFSKKFVSQPRIKNDGLCFDISDKIVVDVNIAFLVIVHGIAFADLNFLNQAHQRGTV